MGKEKKMVDQQVLDKWLARSDTPPDCPFLHRFYCLAGGKGPECPVGIQAGAGAYTAASQCESSMFKARYSRLLNERRAEGK